jgi:hypothetical protein
MLPPATRLNSCSVNSLLPSLVVKVKRSRRERFCSFVISLSWFDRPSGHTAIQYAVPQSGSVISITKKSNVSMRRNRRKPPKLASAPMEKARERALKSAPRFPSSFPGQLSLQQLVEIYKQLIKLTN